MTPDNPIPALTVVLDLIRRGVARSRPDLQRVSGLGRTVIVERLGLLQEVGLVMEGDPGASTGGRAARELIYMDNAGVVLVACATLKGLDVGVADLSGRMLCQDREDGDFAEGPAQLAQRLAEVWRRQLEEMGRPKSDVWAIGCGIPAHIDFASGTLIDSPSLPASWKGYELRRRIEAEFGAPTWIDTDANLLAVGELRAGQAQSHTSMIYIMADLAVGCGIVLEGQLMRGSQGAAGNIGHIKAYDADDTPCRCGRRGCIEAMFGGEAVLRKAVAAQATSSASLADERSELTLEAIGKAAQQGDQAAIDLAQAAGYGIGQVVAATVNVINPTLVLIGGRLLATGPSFFDAMIHAIREHSLPFVADNLSIQAVEHSDAAGLAGAAHMALDELFSAKELDRWLLAKHPAIKATKQTADASRIS